MVSYARCFTTGTEETVTKTNKGTKFAAHYKLSVVGGSSATVKCRLVFRAKASKTPIKLDLHDDFDRIFKSRIAEADGFYDQVSCKTSHCIPLHAV